MLLRKLWADTVALARQTISLSVLIGIGIALYIGMYESYQNVSGSYARIYETLDFADASVLFRSAPEGLVQTARTIPHVRRAVGRLVKDGTIEQRGKRFERVAGRFIASPRGVRPAINNVLIVEGRYLNGPDEAVLEQQFAAKSGYRLGDRLKCAYRTSEREFVIVGFASSPEYVYPVPDRYTMWVSPETFGVVWVDEDRARSWLGAGREITEIHCLVDDGYDAEVVEKLEGLCSAYGVDTSYVQGEQPSKKLLDMDQKGLASMSVFFPVLFLGAAGLFLYVALWRLVRLQVGIIGTLKAMGFSRRDILLQYVGQGCLITQAGAIPGAILGHLMAIGMGSLYKSMLHLPYVLSAPRWDTISAGLLMAALTGLAAAYLPARVAAKLSPAVAMRGDVEGEGATRRWLVDVTSRLAVLYRVPVRGLMRKPSRTVLAIVGVASGAMIIVLTFGQYVAVTGAIDEYLTESRKYEIDVGLTRPHAESIVQVAATVPGVEAVGLTCSLPVTASTSWGSVDMVLMGGERGQKLMRVPSVGGGYVDVAPGEVWLPARMARRIHAERGDPVRLEWVKSGRRERVQTVLRVAGFADEAMGASAYADYREVCRSLADRAYPYASFGAQVDCTPEAAEGVKHRLERSDDVGVVMTTAQIRKQVDEQMGAMMALIVVLLGFGEVLAGSAIHTVSSISLIERTRELATLRSLGFSARATARLASIELYALAGLGLAVGLPMGAAVNTAFINSFSTDNMAFPTDVPLWVHLAATALVLALVSYSSWMGMRRLRGMDLSQATKARE